MTLFQRKGNANISVRTVTYDDDNDYAWVWGLYSDWIYGYSQEENWYNGCASQDGCTRSWIQITLASPVPSTMSDLISPLSSGSTSACAIDAHMTTVRQPTKLNSLFFKQSTLATRKSPEYMMIYTGAAVHVCPRWFFSDYTVHEPYYATSLGGSLMRGNTSSRPQNRTRATQ